MAADEGLPWAGLIPPDLIRNELYEYRRCLIELFCGCVWLLRQDR
jgi:hypothetical protein